MIALLLLALFATPSELDRGYRVARVEFTGPLTEVVFDCGDAGETRVRCDLLAGESVVATLPVPPDVAERLPEVRAMGSGSAKIREWVASTNEAPLSARLIRRTRPPLEIGELRAPPVALLILVAAAVLAWSLRRRPIEALALSLLLTIPAAYLASNAETLGLRSGVVYESDQQLDRSVSVLTMRDQVYVGSHLPIRLEVTPPGRPISIVVESLESGDLLDGVPAFSIKSEGSRLTVLDELPDLETPTGLGRNGLFPLAGTWTRNAAGIWLERGFWGRDEPLPPGKEPGSLPPGWLISGLPQGIPILIARPGGEEDRGNTAADSGEFPSQETWLRVTNFDH